MSVLKIIRFLVIVFLLAACSQKEKTINIIVKNTLNIERTFETVVLTKSSLNIEDITTIEIRDTETGKPQLIQLVDNDGDGIKDNLLFQPRVSAKSEKTYHIVPVNEDQKPKTITNCFSRFVPERADDYAWENDKVAFRVFGPTAQKMAKNNVKGGTLSSGVDAWLKKVDYPIINKWYKKHSEGIGSYHEDTGEGLDNFHVGISRGVGGIAAKIDSTYYYSKNYTKWRTITNGPIRTSFYLEYENWDAAGHSIKESKVISLDLGQHFSKFNINIEGINEISAGLTLHEKDGKVSSNIEKGWISYWQPHDGSELGTAILAAKNSFTGYEKYDTTAKDKSNMYAHLKIKNNQVTYYAGFGWKQNGQFNNSQDWENHLNLFARKINKPLIVTIEN